MTTTIGLQRDEDGLLICRSCGKGAEALNEYRECEDCWRTALEDALPQWKADYCKFERRYLAARL